MNTLLLKNFYRSKGLMIGLLFLFIFGLISLHIGKQFLDKNKEIIKKTANYQQESIARNVAFHSDDLGLLLYYVHFGIVNNLSNLAGLSFGQREVNPPLQSVTIRFLEEQKYNTDLQNPLYQMIGSLDFSFVLIYLFPLIIIALCYNILSEETEEGTWQLVLSQSNQPLKLLQIKIWIRFFSVLFVLFLLFGIAKLYLNLSFDLPFFVFVFCSVLYIGFWFSLNWLIVSFQKSSSQNALILLSLWVFLVILIPVSINVVSKKIYPVPEAFETMLKSRDGYHNKWDEPKEPTVEKFQSIYPQLKQFSHLKEKDFSWFWYYAMQHMGDAESKNEVITFKEKLKQRDKFISFFGFIFPSIHVQLSLNTIAQSDMDNYLQFLNKLEQFHEQKRLYFYPKIFNESKVEEENWKQFGLEYYSQQPNIKWFKSFFPLLFLSLLSLFIANRKFNTSIH